VESRLQIGLLGVLLMQGALSCALFGLLLFLLVMLDRRLHPVWSPRLLWALSAGASLLGLVLIAAFSSATLRLAQVGLALGLILAAYPLSGLARRLWRWSVLRRISPEGRWPGQRGKPARSISDMGRPDRPSPEERRLHSQLLSLVQGDADVAARLIAYEWRQAPDLPRVEHLRLAVSRLERDRMD
jgi:hypothetical protein